MLIEVKIGDNTSVEIEEKCWNGAHPGFYQGPWEKCYPAEGDETEFIRAWIVHQDRRREVDVRKVIQALERRYGVDWRNEAYVLS